MASTSVRVPLTVRGEAELSPPLELQNGKARVLFGSHYVFPCCFNSSRSLAYCRAGFSSLGSSRAALMRRISLRSAVRSGSFASSAIVSGENGSPNIVLFEGLYSSGSGSFPVSFSPASSTRLSCLRSSSIFRLSGWFKAPPIDIFGIS